MGHKVENLFAKRKDWRPITTRYDRCASILGLPSSWPLGWSLLQSMAVIRDQRQEALHRS